jgi:hypothetical protein
MMMMMMMMMNIRVAKPTTGIRMLYYDILNSRLATKNL